VPFFPPTDPQGLTKLERIGVVATGPLQLLLTAASMVGCINAIVGGVAVALALRSLLNTSVLVAAVTGALVAVGLAALCFGYQVRRFGRAAVVMPELYEGQALTCPGGLPPDQSTGSLWVTTSTGQTSGRCGRLVGEFGG